MNDFSSGEIPILVRKDEISNMALNRLADVTFVIPVRIDSPDRSRNVDVLIDFLFQRFDSPILIMESDSQQRYFVKQDDPRIRYFFNKDRRPVFHHTGCLNQLYPMVDTPIIAGWDTDALVASEQIIDTVEQVRSGKVVMGLAYDGHMFNTSAELVQLFWQTKDYNVLTEKTGELRPMYGALSTGGAFIVDTEKYLQAGGENEHFLGWGPEDFERVKRIEILYPQPIYRAKGGLYHMAHTRLFNSWYADRHHELNGKKEFLKVCGMTRDELWTYVNSWHWREGLITRRRVNAKQVY